MTGAEQRVLAALGRALGKSGRGSTAVVCGGPMAGRVGIVLARRGWRVRMQADTADTLADIERLKPQAVDMQLSLRPFATAAAAALLVEAGCATAATAPAGVPTFVINADGSVGTADENQCRH